jgi:hypothetical protein
MKIDEWRGAPPKTELVFIGNGFDEEGLRKQFDELIDQSPQDLSNDTIMDVLRYK